ncbi:N-acetylmuramoyl-L-alanine amidase family protein [Puia sp. P3]|uniref:N-acetylmuramoyl-L-alanine amidase family protein n=1 Tax=Puia sp. P3 TaxID=3423952 RepID=UPI003D670C94
MEGRPWRLQRYRHQPARRRRRRDLRQLGRSQRRQHGLRYDLPRGHDARRPLRKRYFANSALFASLVEEQFASSGRNSEGVKQRDEGIRVLQATGMPSVLVEIGFLSNVEEENYLNSEEGQNEVVKNIMDAFRRYKSTLEGHPIPAPEPAGPPSKVSNSSNQ